MRELLAGLVPGLPASRSERDRRPGRRDAAVRRRDRPDAPRRGPAEAGRRPVRPGRRPDQPGRARDPDRPDRLASRRPDRRPTGPSSPTPPSWARASPWPACPPCPAVPEAELEPRLRALVRRELLTLQADPRSPERGQYAFVQALIREVAYNTLARRDRKSRHLAAARFFEALGSDELAGALAGHYLAAQANASRGSRGGRTGGPGPDRPASCRRAGDQPRFARPGRHLPGPGPGRDPGRGRARRAPGASRLVGVPGRS
jgi:hypothetical protein